MSNVIVSAFSASSLRPLREINGSMVLNALSETGQRRCFVNTMSGTIILAEIAETAQRTQRRIR